MMSKPRRGIPPEELGKLQQLREKLAQVKVSTKDGNHDDDGGTKAENTIEVGKLQMIDVAANLTNFRYVRLYHTL